MAIVTCLSCGGDVKPENSACERCGSADRAIHDIDHAFGIDESLRLAKRHGQPGQVRPYELIFDEVRWNHDRQRNERRRMVVDRENDRYVQEWYHQETGERWSKSGRLSDPEVHGESARRSRGDDS
jgi:hypothetical protein